MPRYNAKDADWKVVSPAYSTAVHLTNDPVVLLALFEAGMVESNFHNHTSATDHDSLGYLQQRPSQGWPNPTDIPTATRSFITRATANRKKHPHYSAGQLAQSVQISAYPDRYNQAQAAAQELLATARNGRGPISTDPAFFPINPLGGLDVLANVIRTAAAPLISTGKIADQVFKVFMPSNFIRVVSGVAGSMFLLFGIYLLTKEVRNG